jgi:hypothetical protein
MHEQQKDDDQLGLDANHFFSEGYVILKNCIPKEECERYMQNVVSPTLDKYKISLDNAATWTLTTTDEHKTDEECIGDVPVGVMVRGEHGSDPIHNVKEQRWKALFECSTLLSFLNYIHEGRDKWRWLHDDNVGWIHLRFPVAKKVDNDDSAINWHIDGGHFDLHKLNSLEQSVVVLPMMQKVNIDGGNTLVAPKSHIIVMKELYNRLPNGLHKEELNQFANNVGMREDTLQAAPCDAGDLLVMHPFLVHAASRNKDQNPVRVSFNMGTCWTEKKRSFLQKQPGVRLSPIEDHIIEVCGNLNK